MRIWSFIILIAIISTMLLPLHLPVPGKFGNAMLSGFDVCSETNESDTADCEDTPSLYERPCILTPLGSCGFAIVHEPHDSSSVISCQLERPPRS